MNQMTKAFLKSGYISCLVTIIVAVGMMFSGFHFAGSEMVFNGLKVLLLSEIIGFAIELNNKLK